MKVAVVAHSGKTLGGGLPELRRVLAAEGIADPFWCEVPKSRKAPAQVRRALERGRRAHLRLGWRRDGAAVRRRARRLEGAASRSSRRARRTCSPPTSASPRTSRRRSRSGFAASGSSLDVGRFNGERFAVMAGAGFDAAMIRDAGDGGLKERFGRVAYVWTGSENLRSKPFRAEIEVDGAAWFKGKASCILLGNVGKLFGGVEAFEDATSRRRQARARCRDGRGAPRMGPHDRPHGGRARRTSRRSRRRRRPAR